MDLIELERAAKKKRRKHLTMAQVGDMIAVFVLVISGLIIITGP